MAKESDFTRIYAQGKLVGRVEGNTFFKTIRKKHLLKVPPAIAIDVDSLEQAERAGATRVEINIRETSEVFEATIAHIKKLGWEFDRGWGKQIGLSLDGGWIRRKPGGGIQLEMELSA